MKKNLLKLFAVALAVMLALCACSAQDTESAQAQDDAQTMQNTEKKKLSEASSVTQTAAALDTGDLFSGRDLSADYDDTVVTITLGQTPQCSADTVSISGQIVTIKAAGTYILSGTLTDGYILVDAGKEDKVQLVLDGADITSSDFAAIYVRQADKVFVTAQDGTVNTLTNGGNFTPIDENDVDAVIYAKDDLTINGSGALTITSPAGHGVVCRDELVLADVTLTVEAAQTAVRANDSIAIASGNYVLTAGNDGIHAENNDDDTLGGVYISGGSFTIAAGDDAVHAETVLQIDGGTMQITAAEGLEATYVQINGGDVTISASDDGVNAARKSSAYTPTFEMTGGTLTIVMGQGDTDGIDSNGDILVSGGTIDVTGNSSFDYDGTAQFTGGTIIINGQQVDSIPNQFMGGGFGGMGGFGGQGPGQGQFPGGQMPENGSSSGSGQPPQNGQFPGGASGAVRS